MSEAIYSLLQSVEADTYPGVAPPRVDTPYIVFRQISKVPEHTKDSHSLADHYRWQVSIFSDSYDEAEQLAASCRTALEAYKGKLEGVDIDDIILDDEGYFFEEDNNARMHHFYQDYLIIEKK